MHEAPGRKRGRPAGPSRTYTTQDAQGNVSKTHLSPFAGPRTRARRAGSPDQPVTILEHESLAAPSAALEASAGDCQGTPESAPHTLEPMSPPPTAALADSPGAVQPDQPDLYSYARQLAGYLGGDFRPVCCVGEPTKQACFCIPDWNPIAAALNAKRFHLPGLRSVTFADGDCLTWWCDCHHSLESARNMFANADFPHQPADWLEGRPDMCIHLKALEVSSL